MAQLGVCVGIDLGGSKIHVGAVDREGRIHAPCSAPTAAAQGTAR